jgi:hypothetical protein
VSCMYGIHSIHHWTAAIGGGPSGDRARPLAMKKSITRTKLALKRETLKVLKADHLELVIGGGPVVTRDLPCIELTARDCD